MIRILQALLIGTIISTAAGSVQAQSFDLPLPGKPFPVGINYYPEHRQPTQWERDIKRFSELGFGFTHYAEFEWSKLEPEEGRYEFDWLDSCLEL